MYQLLHSEITPTFTVGSLYSRVSDFTLKERGYRTQATAANFQILKEESDNKMFEVSSFINFSHSEITFFYVVNR